MQHNSQTAYQFLNLKPFIPNLKPNFTLFRYNALTIKVKLFGTSVV